MPLEVPMRVAPDPGPERRWALAWAVLCLAFAIHVTDEAAHDFLAWFNPNALALRERVPWLPVPVFTFRGWLTALIAVILALATLTPLVYRGHRWLIPLAYLFGAVHVLNGLGHIVVSIAGAWWAPGVLSAPAVLAGGLWLLRETAHVRRSDGRRSR